MERPDENDQSSKIGRMNKRDTVVIFYSQDRITLPQFSETL